MSHPQLKSVRSPDDVFRADKIVERSVEIGETFVSSTVRDMVSADDVVFEDRGSHALKGVDAQRQLYAARVRDAAEPGRYETT